MIACVSPADSNTHTLRYANLAWKKLGSTSYWDCVSASAGKQHVYWLVTAEV